MIEADDHDAGGAFVHPDDREYLGDELFSHAVVEGDLKGDAVLTPTIQKRFDPGEKRDASGEWTAGGNGAGTANKPTSKPAAKTSKIKYATPGRHAAVIAKALAKFEAAPLPSKQELREAKKGLAKLGANKYRKNLVGNSTDRAKRRKALQTEFGDGTKCPCLYCGVYIGDAIGEGTLEQDKVYTTAQGGRYRVSNLVPSCSDCNKVRGDKPFADFIKGIKPDAE